MNGLERNRYQWISLKMMFRTLWALLIETIAMTYVEKNFFLSSSSSSVFILRVSVHSNKNDFYSLLYEFKNEKKIIKKQIDSCLRCDIQNRMNERRRFFLLLSVMLSSWMLLRKGWTQQKITFYYILLYPYPFKGIEKNKINWNW